GENCVDVDAALLKKIGGKPANYYVNVHTAKFPAGAVRGQLQN
ncbi:MAG: CHRD domain-containing protein, partial [Rhizobiales bacterium]|nr:CHRD domain-containing protein [Hyphomicrobiales bacterium]